MIYIILVLLGFIAFFHDFFAKKIRLKYVYISLFVYPFLAMVFLFYDVVKIDGESYSYLFSVLFAVIFISNLKLWFKKDKEE